MTAVDTSVSVPALLVSHEAHDACREAAAGTAIPAHALVETVAVLTRLPPPRRLSVELVGRLVDRWTGERTLPFSPAGQRAAIDVCRRAGIRGGALYDAVVALTAREGGHVLLTRDARAVRTYEALAVPYQLVES